MSHFDMHVSFSGRQSLIRMELRDLLEATLIAEDAGWVATADALMEVTRLLEIDKARATLQSLAESHDTPSRYHSLGALIAQISHPVI